MRERIRTTTTKSTERVRVRAQVKHAEYGIGEIVQVRLFDGETCYAKIMRTAPVLSVETGGRTIDGAQVLGRVQSSKHHLGYSSDYRFEFFLAESGLQLLKAPTDCAINGGGQRALGSMTVNGLVQTADEVHRLFGRTPEQLGLRPWLDARDRQRAQIERLTASTGRGSLWSLLPRRRATSQSSQSASPPHGNAPRRERVRVRVHDPAPASKRVRIRVRP